MLKSKLTNPMSQEKKCFEQKKSINIGGKIISLDQPKVMGILNLTPDSFFPGSRVSSESQLLKKVDLFLKDGATFIDLGGYSSRPGAVDISSEEEITRVLNAIKLISKRFPEAILSIDTFRANVAEQALYAGAHLVNDVSAGNLDEKMFETVARFNVPYIIMHMQGTPHTMQKNPIYKTVVLDIIDFFVAKVAELTKMGVKDILIDPGFGFGKTLAHNYQILNRLNDFTILGLPILAGLSRKGMIYNPLKVTAEQALNGTTVLNTLALQNGASILRVHDVREAVECIKLYSFFVNN